MSPGFESITLSTLEEEFDVLSVYLCCVSWNSLENELQLNGNKKSIKSERKLLTTTTNLNNHDCKHHRKLSSLTSFHHILTVRFLFPDADDC